MPIKIKPDQEELWIKANLGGKGHFFFGAPSARAFGAGLRPWPSATISYHLCNFWHPASPISIHRMRPRVPEVAQVIADGGRRPGPKARAEGARRRRPEEKMAFSPKEPLPYGPEPLPFGLNGAFGGRLRRSEPSPARRAPSAQ